MAQFEHGARWLRQTPAVLVGARSEAGLLPPFLSTCFAFIQKVCDGVGAGPLAWASFGVAGVRLMAVQALQGTHCMEQIALPFAGAIEMQRSGKVGMS